MDEVYDEITLHSEKPIYLQMAQNLKDRILSGEFPEGERMPGAMKLAERYGINHLTMNSAMTVLVDEYILSRERGRGCFVKSGAVKEIRKREEGFFDEFMIPQIVRRAKFLERDPEKVMEMIKAEFEK